MRITRLMLTFVFELESLSGTTIEPVAPSPDPGALHGHHGIMSSCSATIHYKIFSRLKECWTLILFSLNSLGRCLFRCCRVPSFLSSIQV